MARIKQKVKQKLFVIRKYIYADNAFQALQRERKHAPDDCWVDEGWRLKQENINDLQSAIGFVHYPEEE